MSSLNIKPIPPLDIDTERQLVTAAQNGNQHAFETLLASQVRYLQTLAARSMGETLSFDECLATALEGFTKAVKTFPLDRGIRLSTHLTQHVRATMSELVAELTTAAPIAARTRRKYEEAIRNTLRNGQVDVDAAATYAASRPDERSRMSHETFMAVHAQITGTAIPAENETDYGPTTDIGFESNVVDRQWAKVALTSLDDTSRQVLELAYGLGDNEPLADSAIADVIGLSRSRVQALRQSALTQVRQTLSDL